MRPLATLSLTLSLLTLSSSALVQFDRDRPPSLPPSSSSSSKPGSIRRPSQLQFKWASSRNNNNNPIKANSPPPSAPGSGHPLKLVLSTNQDSVHHNHHDPHDPNPDSDSYYDLDATHHHHGITIDTAPLRSALQRLPTVRNPLPDLGVRKGLSRGSQRLGRTLVSLRGGGRGGGSLSRMEEEEEFDRAEARREKGQRRKDWWRGLAARTRMINRRRRPGGQRGMEVVLSDDLDDDDEDGDGTGEDDEWENAWRVGEGVEGGEEGAVELDLEVSEALDELRNEDGASLGLGSSSRRGGLQRLKGTGEAWRRSWYRAAKGLPVAVGRDQ